MADIEQLRKDFAAIENDLLIQENQTAQDLLIKALVDECHQKNLQISIVPEAGGYRLEISGFTPKIYSDIYSLLTDGWKILETIDTGQNFDDSDTSDMGFELID